MSQSPNVKRKNVDEEEQIPKSLASIFNPEPDPLIVEEQKTEEKVSGVPFKSLFLTNKTKLKDNDTDDNEDDVRVTMAAPKATTQDDLKYGYDQTIFGSFKEVIGDNARAMIQQMKEKDKEKDDKMAQFKDQSFFNFLREKYLSITTAFANQQYVDPIIFFLIIMGSLTAIIAIGVDIIADIVNFTRLWFLHYFTKGFLAGFIFWILYAAVFMFFAIFFTHYLSPASTGPGIPELKCILSGVTIGNFLTFRTLLAKILGLLCSFMASLVIGQEGPIVHIASCITELMTKLNCFKKIGSNPTIRSQVLGAACAAGVACTYSSSVGGVLFSIEVTSVYYPIRNYWYAFVASVPAGILFRIVWNVYLGETLLRPFVPMNFGENRPQWYEWFLFIIISLIGSSLGIIFIRVNYLIVSFRRKYGPKYPIFGPFPYTILVGALTAILLYPRLFGNFMTFGNPNTLIDLYGEEDLRGLNKNWDWASRPVILSLFVFFIIRYILSIMTNSAALPCGMFAQMLVQGAALGRIFGELARMYLPKSVSPGIYAVVCGAAAASSTTQTISTAMIIFETTGDITSSYIVLLVVIISVGFSKLFTPNLYDTALIIRRLPYLPNIKHGMEDWTAADLMVQDVPCIPMKTSIRQIKRVIQQYLKSEMNVNETNIPIVDKLNSKILIGATKLSLLRNFVQKLEKEILKEEKLLDSKTISTLLPGESDVKKLRSELMRLKFDIRPRLKELAAGNPAQFLPDTSLQIVHIQFCTMKISNAFVVKNGRLKGVIPRSSFVEALKKHKKTKKE